MKITSPGRRLSRMLMDNVSLGVKFGTTLGYSNALLESLKEITERGEEKRGW